MDGAGRIERTLPRGKVEGRMEATALERKLSELDCPFEIEVHTRECKEGRTEKQPISDEALARLEKRFDQIWRDCGWPDEKHYGLWHDDNGWWWRQDRIFITEHRAVALAQEDAVNRFRPGDWRVRCIEEWADEQ